MAVYTELSKQEFESFLNGYALGDLDAAIPISAGIENTNYKVVTTEGKYVLTIFEHHDLDEVSDFVRLAQHLGEQGLPIPSPIADKKGTWLHQLKSKPAVLCRFFSGSHLTDIDAEHCAQIGRGMAEFHLASQGVHNPKADVRGYDWWQTEGMNLASHLPKEDQDLLADELAYHKHCREHWLSLPQGWIHGDMFHDNALFDGHELTAIIDLYNACDGAWIYDLAVIANDWCTDDQDQLDDTKVNALLEAYNKVRPIKQAEYDCWALALRAAALRFWLSRLLTEKIVAQEGQTMPAHKQPVQFRDILLLRRALPHQI